MSRIIFEYAISFKQGPTRPTMGLLWAVGSMGLLRPVGSMGLLRTGRLIYGPCMGRKRARVEIVRFMG